MTSKRNKYTLDDCRKTASLKNAKCLSTEYVNNSTPMIWECSNGHITNSNYTSYKRGKSCQKCGPFRRKHSIQTCHDQAKTHEGLCLAKTYNSCTEQLEWQCSMGHTWFSSLTVVLEGRWCARCNYGLNIIEDLHAKALEHGGICLSNTYHGVRHKYSWKCLKGHEWQARWIEIKTGRWCRQCFYDDVTLSIEECQKDALKRRGKCLSTAYKSVNESYQWECEKGHKWFARYIHIRAGAWCPICKESRGEVCIRNVLDQLSIKYISQQKFEGCLSPSNIPLKFDFFIPEENTLIEVDGDQHFECIDYFGGIEGFQKRITNDLIKVEYCLENSITLIRVAFDEPLEETLCMRLEQSFDRKFVMSPLISSKYKDQVTASFGEEHYETFYM